MSRLTDLLAQARAKDPQLAADLEGEIRQLTQGRRFGLVFERHQPEGVELPGRPIRVGDTVRVLPPRGSTHGGDSVRWRVTSLRRTSDGVLANLESEGDEAERETRSVSTADLVAVAGIQDRIFPGLVETGRVERGGDKPFHTVINAENFHALEMLTYTHRHKVDCIYIDPPYNTGAKDWKYNNDYVESDDDYRHSKWLSFMERRLQVARELLIPEDSVLIVTIDEKEVHRLGMLLGQIFPDARIQMISSVINPKGAVRSNEFSRTDEYIFFVMLGGAGPSPLAGTASGSSLEPIHWQPLRRSDITSARGTSKGGASQFYPIYVDPTSGIIKEIGEALAHGVDRATAPQVPGAVTVFPVRPDGTEINWGLTAPSLRRLLEKGYVRAGKRYPEKPQQYNIAYLTSGRIRDIKEGRASVSSVRADGSVEAFYTEGSAKGKMPETLWREASHNAQHFGTILLTAMLGRRGFPFPKSLYAVEDAIRFFVANKPSAVIVDFFAGSGTTAHAVMRLNKQDGGRRQCISVTNNEVSADEQKGLRKKGLRPGDPEWEQWGICDYITKPRITAAITGKTPAGNPIKGDYKFTDEFPMADGFAENAAFFTLTYEAPLEVRHHRAFERIAPLLWMRAGSRGRIIMNLGARGWDVAEAYGVLESIDQAAHFLEALESRDTVETAYIVTDSAAAYQNVARALPERVTPVRLYESYLHNFQINRRD
ncbi:site-specific DNA-methyltransferase [Micrococcus luteus]|uniref:site-specific DNA-methyltransferase n=3 Tax=Actinomycetes TaxID=1760 RepID=UPI000C7C96EF|nr:MULTISPECIES: DNA methyltransferase [Micrococcus]MBF0755063.1 site-specific DNA-methyltransferase [Micrococcus aloeverae]MCO0632404.1 site-specific DNA-methyltransferase [Micrococcus yunnanensis]MCT1810955.1 site-specific DNA-methyltransferase [Micrococcus luteus]MCT1856259.1 site-specific DNA-methyltransferase [Micrococcus luteus]MCV7469477.1 DNA methyltransferase [Micrococcus luteus]